MYKSQGYIFHNLLKVFAIYHFIVGIKSFQNISTHSHSGIRIVSSVTNFVCCSCLGKGSSLFVTPLQ